MIARDHFPVFRVFIYEDCNNVIAVLDRPDRWQCDYMYTRTFTIILDLVCYKITARRLIIQQKFEEARSLALVKNTPGLEGVPMNSYNIDSNVI